MVTHASAPPGRAHRAVQVKNLRYSRLKTCATVAQSCTLLYRRIPFCMFPWLSDHPLLACGRALLPRERGAPSTSRFW